MCRNNPASDTSRHTLIDLFHDFAGLKCEFLRYDNGYRSWRYSYAEVANAARNFAVRLRAQGIGKGDKVIIWSENRPEWIAAFWGCVLQGVVPVPIDYRSSASFLRRVEQIVDARLILTGEEVQLPSWERQPAVWRLVNLEWTAPTTEMPPVPISREDIAEIVFTSGATGEPKGVVITHGNILANLVSLEQIVARYEKWFRPLFPLRFLSLIPLSHMFGQALTIFFLPLVPAAAVFMRGYSPHEVVRQIRTRRVSVVVAVPKLLEVLREHILHQFPNAGASTAAESHWILRWWRYRRIHSMFGWKFWAFVVGAAPLQRDLEEFWTRLGFAVIQGYGLTETAPIVAFNNPFDISRGTVGKPIAGMEVKIAPDGELLVRGNSLTPGYFQAADKTAAAFEDGWFHTGDIGDVDDAGNLTIRGRKKEVIVTPEGLNVFPEDIEHALNALPGVRESAAVGKDRVHAVLVLDSGANPEETISRANLQLEDHQKIRSFSVWPKKRLPRTETTQKLKRAEIQKWAEGDVSESPAGPAEGGLIGIVQRLAPDRRVTPETTLDELGLSSLDRVELMIDLEQHFDSSIDESLLTGARTVAQLGEISTSPTGIDFPQWNRSWWANAVRRATLATVWLPLIRVVACARVSGREHLYSLSGPVIFAPNHQSHLDTPCILTALPQRFRCRLAVAMWKEYFDAHFHPERHARSEWLVNSVVYWLVALFFNGFPLPQTEAGARQSLRYVGDLVSEGWSILFFPEGERTEGGEIHPFQAGIGLLGSRLDIPVVPVRLRGLEKVLHRHSHWPHPGRVELIFGPPLLLKGNDYVALAKQVEAAVSAL